MENEATTNIFNLSGSRNWERTQAEVHDSVMFVMHQHQVVMQICFEHSLPLMMPEPHSPLPWLWQLLCPRGSLADLLMKEASPTSYQLYKPDSVAQ